ncbi:polysaccharide deacetylase family protein [Lentzea sp.]|uniref:polysaccharide deacetylase family protein n=1 Tax=Lentzea sp. TaxID=56099 RepID=UPI002ED3C2F1
MTGQRQVVPVPATVPSPIITNGPRAQRKVALTFDADLTAAMRDRLVARTVSSYADMRIVDELVATSTPATFFFTGLWMETYPEQTRRIGDHRMFELATHSQTHRGFREKCFRLGLVPPDEMHAEVVQPITTLQGLTGRATNYFRFPGGCWTDDALRIVLNAGMTVVHWDVESGDAFCESADVIVDKVVANVRPGSIVLFHLGGPNAPRTADALPRILAALAERDLTPVTLTDLLHP